MARRAVRTCHRGRRAAGSAAVLGTSTSGHPLTWARWEGSHPIASAATPRRQARHRALALPRVRSARSALDAPVRLPPWDPAAATISAEAELAVLRAAVGVLPPSARPAAASPGEAAAAPGDASAAEGGAATVDAFEAAAAPADAAAGGNGDGGGAGGCDAPGGIADTA